MKTLVLINEGILQLVLTPETDWEHHALHSIGERGEANEVVLKRGSFYECQAGYVRQSETDESLIITTKKK